MRYQTLSPTMVSFFVNGLPSMWPPLSMIAMCTVVPDDHFAELEEMRNGDELESRDDDDFER